MNIFPSIFSSVAAILCRFMWHKADNGPSVQQFLPHMNAHASANHCNSCNNHCPQFIKRLWQRGQTCLILYVASQLKVCCC